MAAPDTAAPARRQRWLVMLAAVPIGMALLAFVAFPPFYSLWCEITGTGLNNSGTGAPALGAPSGRPIETYFTSQVYDGLPVSLGPATPAIAIRPGETGYNIYRFVNRSDKPVRFRPVHSVAPVQAAGKFIMMECFCFNDQEVEAHGVREYPVAFTFARDIDQRIPTVTVSYALFRIDPDAKPSDEMLRIRAMVEANGGVVSPPIPHQAERP